MQQSHRNLKIVLIESSRGLLSISHEIDSYDAIIFIGNAFDLEFPFAIRGEILRDKINIGKYFDSIKMAVDVKIFHTDQTFNLESSFIYRSTKQHTHILKSHLECEDLKFNIVYPNSFNNLRKYLATKMVDFRAQLVLFSNNVYGYSIPINYLYKEKVNYHTFKINKITLPSGILFLLPHSDSSYYYDCLKILYLALKEIKKNTIFYKKHPRDFKNITNIPSCTELRRSIPIEFYDLKSFLIINFDSSFVGNHKNTINLSKMIIKSDIRRKNMSGINIDSLKELKHRINFFEGR
jgi:hypothetical protein